ncbi:hypothetical protein WMY93_015805 [Mugilogobius chulae]|uniref:Solute carrier family 10 member 1 n=1 Tax=Mugilogobius chulae TaxID=88201 RepID=A0AAW0P3C1_9GOBI
MENVSAVHVFGNDSLNGTLDFVAPGAMARTLNFIMIGCVFVTMVSLGCTMEIARIKAHIVKPKGVAIALLAQYGIMPLTAFSLAKAFQLPEMASVVVLICGCSPGGLLSNMSSLFIKGDMNLSIVMTTFSTVLALGMMPLLLFIYCQGFEGIQDAIPYKDIALSLLIILIPCGIGILINHYRPKYSNFITKAGLILSSVVMSVVVTLNTLKMKTDLAGLTTSILAVAALMPIIGYTFGYLLSRLLRLSQTESRTVSMETGCQNGQLCLALVSLLFPPEVIGALLVFPLIYVLSQLCWAVLLVLLFRTHQYFTQRNKGAYQAANPEMQEVGTLEKIS